MHTKEDLHRQNLQMQHHDELQFREQEYMRRRATPPSRFINPADPDILEMLIDDIESTCFMHHTDKIKQAADYLRFYSFSEDAIDRILADIPHETRVDLAYWEAVRIQQLRATEGTLEEPKPAPPQYPVKTLVLGPSPAATTEETRQASDAIESSESEAHLILRLSPQQILSRLFNLETGEERILFLRSCGLSDEEQVTLYDCLTVSEKEDYLKQLYRPQSHHNPTRSKQDHPVATVPAAPPQSAPVSDSRVVHSTVADGEFFEASAVPIDVVSVAAAKPSPVPPASQSEPKVKSKKSKLAEDIIFIRNAHFPRDRSGTLNQSELEKWVPDIKTLPKYTAFDLFGELNGEMVDLYFYVNRVGLTCYVGDEFNPESSRNKLTWSTGNLGPLPNNKKGEKYELKVISITPHQTDEATGGNHD